MADNPLQTLGDALTKLAKESHGLSAGWPLAGMFPLLCERILELGKPVLFGKREVTVAEAKDLMALAKKAGTWVGLTYDEKPVYIPYVSPYGAYHDRVNFEREYIESWPIEQQWLYDRQSFYNFSQLFGNRVHQKHPADARRFRLLACAMARRVWDLLPEAPRQAIVTAEDVADGRLGRDALSMARKRCGKGKAQPAETYALLAARGTTESGPHVAFRASSNNVLTALKIQNESAEEADNTTLIRLVRDIFGNPFRQPKFDPAWITSTVHDLAISIYREHSFEAMPVLSDALEAAGCDDAEILDHCRQPLTHVRGCWVVDLILGRGKVPMEVPAGTLSSKPIAEPAKPTQKLSAILKALESAELGRDWIDGPMQIAVQVLHPDVQFAGSDHDARQLQIVGLLGWPRVLCYAIAGANAGLDDVADRRTLAVGLFKTIPLGGKPKKIALAQSRRVAAEAAMRAHPLGCDATCPLHVAVMEMVAGERAPQAAEAMLEQCTKGGSLARQPMRPSSSTSHGVVVAYRHLIAAYADRSPNATAPNAAREAARAAAKVEGVHGALKMCLEISRGLGVST